MPVQVLMPQFGESVNEGTITNWLKSIGEQVNEYDPLVEVNTDKVDTEIPSPATGTLLEILIPTGSTVKAGTLLAVIGSPGEAVLTRTTPLQEEKKISITPIAEPTMPLSVELHTPEHKSSRTFISPVVSRLASEFHIDLAKVNGTGLGGRITKKDLQAYIEKRPLAETSAISTSIPVPSSQPKDGASFTPGSVLPLTPVRRSIAEHMVSSRHTSPHVTTIMEVDLSKTIAHREANKAVFAREDVNLTFTAYFIIAAVAALKAYPIVNSSWKEEGIFLHPSINIGMATSLGESGLIVPVIKNADSLSLLGVARMVNDLAVRARNRQLKPEEVQGGTFTITNHGVSGSLFATPIINQPQSAIMGVGAIQKRPIVISDEALGDVIAIRSMVYLGLTFDHRILDGVIADNFLSKVVQTLQNWS